MITENVSSLKIHQLTKEQYERELEAGNIKKNELYLVSEDEEPSGTLHWDDIEGKPFYEEDGNVVQYLPEKFIPSTIARTNDIQNYIDEAILGGEW